MSGKTKMRIFCVLFAAVVVVLAFAPCALATRVSVATIEGCLVNENGFNCNSRVCISADVSYGIQTSLEVVDVVMIQVDGEPVEIEETINIEIEKSIPTLTYPLRFLHTVAYYPYEEVIRTAHPLSGCTCQCAEAIPDSQGFCSIKDPFQLQYGDASCAGWRGEELIGQPATTAVPYATAHCLKMGELYFHGYEICEPTEYYEITANLTKGELAHNFLISPADPFYAVDQGAGGFKLKAELLGNLEKYKSVPDLSNYILYIPAAPDTHPMVQDYQNNMLLLPREELSKDGSELDKVGISYYAFRKLAANASVSEAGDGLHNQLFHKQNADLMKLIMDPDAETEYLVHGKKKFKESMDFQSGMKKVLQYKVPEINYSQMALTMDLTTLKVVSTESLGVIVSADVQAFTSMTDDGTLEVDIRNYGDIKTDYVVTVTNPNTNIVHAIPAQARILAPMEQATLKFDIHTAYNLDTTNQFLVQLKSPTGRLYDGLTVVFDTFKHPSKYPWDLQLKNQGSTLTEPSDLTAPVITLNGSDLILLECNVDSYTEQGAQAVDDVDGAVSVTIGGDTVDTTVCGIYIVKYFARDALCNFSEIIRTVKVVCPGPWIEGDINRDNQVDMQDLGRLAANWLTGV